VAGLSGPVTAGRSAVVAGLGGWSPAADRQSRSNQVPGGGRRRPAWAGSRVGLTVDQGVKCRLAGLALVSAALQPVGGRPLARPAVGSRGRRRRAPDPLALPCLRRFLAAVLRIVRARSGPSSPCRSSRGLRPGKVFSGAPSSLISSEDFPGPCPHG
jgi:hypothetical protein